MKKGYFTFLLVLLPFAFIGQIELKRQVAWGASFVPQQGEQAGVLVRRVMSRSLAETAGLKTGDIILNANGILLSTPAKYFKTFRSFRAGDVVTLDILRNNELIQLKATLTPRPFEQYKDIDVQYGSLITSKGHQLRTILTKPMSAKNKLPVILLTQWLSCGQVELNIANMDGSDSLLFDLITRSGFAFMRVEKPGIGDSNGPDCSECDYDSELAAYQAAFKQVKKMSFIDTNAIYILGVSIGASSAPLVFQNENIKGIIVTGGFSKTWYEHMLEIERRRLALTGIKQGEINATMRQFTEFYDYFLNHKMTPAQVVKERPHLNGIWYDEEAHQYGRPAVYYQQVQEKNVAAAWEKVQCPVLIIYGEYDWIMSRADHELIAEIVNGRKPANAALHIIPKMSHNITIHPTLQDSFDDRNGLYAGQVRDIILDWLKKH